MEHINAGKWFLADAFYCKHLSSAASDFFLFFSLSGFKEGESALKSTSSMPHRTQSLHSA